MSDLVRRLVDIRKLVLINMHIYLIRDVWMALILSAKNLFAWVIAVSILGWFASTSFNVWPLMIVFIMFGLAQSILIYFSNRSYVIDLNTGMFTFPRSDMENSIIEIVLFSPYWNLMRTKAIHASEIENVFLDTKRWSTKRRILNGKTTNGSAKYKSETRNHIRYTINIAGTFGSANLQFRSRQKRDEVRNAIQQAVKKYSGHNTDIKVAEFS